MRAMRQQRVGGPEVLELVEVADPTPGPGEVLVRVAAAGVNPVDAAVRGGFWPILGEPPFVVGWDLAGTVEQVGAGVAELSVGDRVFGMPRFPEEAAAYAELAVVPAEELALTPAVWTDVEAAAVPLAGLTAFQALVEVADVQPGQRVLVQGAGGGVGHLAVQVAKARGGHVTAVVSPAKAAVARSAGADQVVDYTTGRWTEGLGRFDVALDPFGSPNAQSVLALVHPGGTAVSLLDVDDDAREAAERLGVRLERIFVHPSGEQLAQLAAWAGEGRLRPHVSATFPLEKAATAHQELTIGHPGKLVLVC